MTRHGLWCSLFVHVLGCATAPAPVRLPASEPLVLPGSDGVSHDVGAEVARSTLTVFVFYSRDCPCLRVHEARLHELADEYRARGVSVLLIDSEVGAEPGRDALEARRRGYRLPLLTDAGGRLAKAVQAEFATHAVVVDANGNVRYSGGLDSDKNHLHAGARPYLRDALDEILAGRAPSPRRPEPLGCALVLD